MDKIAPDTVVNLSQGLNFMLLEWKDSVLVLYLYCSRTAKQCSDKSCV